MVKKSAFRRHEDAGVLNEEVQHAADCEQRRSPRRQFPHADDRDTEATRSGDAPAIRLTAGQLAAAIR